jgi:CheY-like chemotaxis protein
MPALRKILLAEDEPDIAELFGLALTSAGFSVEIVNNGAEAIKKLKSFKPDLLLLDLVMPDIDGYEVLDSIKSDKSFRGPIYVWSNLTQKSEIDKATKAGADGYIVKSNFTPAKLVEKVREILS